MVVAAGQHKGIAQQGLEQQVGLLGADEVQAEVRLAAGHAVQYDIGAFVHHLDADVGELRMKARDHRRQEVMRRRRHAGDRHFA